MLRAVELTDQQREMIVKRLRRVEGQVRGIQSMIEEERECGDVVTQFSAALKALEQSAFKYFSATLAQCALEPDRASQEGYTAQKLEKMFLQLA